MDGIRSSSGGSGCLLAVRPRRRVSPRGEALPRSPGRGGQGGPGAPSPPDAEQQPGPGEAPARWACGAEKRERKARRGEARTWGQRRLPRNFAVKSRNLRERKNSPIRPLLTASPARRADFALSIRCCVQRPLPPPQTARWGEEGADAGGPRLGWAPRLERKSRRPWRQLRGVLARTRLPLPPVMHQVLACAPLLGRTGHSPGPEAAGGAAAALPGASCFLP